MGTCKVSGRFLVLKKLLNIQSRLWSWPFAFLWKNVFCKVRKHALFCFVGVFWKFFFLEIIEWGFPLRKWQLSLFDQLAREKHYYVRLRAHSKMARSGQILFYVRSSAGAWIYCKNWGKLYWISSAWRLGHTCIWNSHRYYPNFLPWIQVLVGELNLR